MPNWCNNNVHVTHKDPEKVRELTKVLEANGNVFEHLCPMPEELRQTTSPNTTESAALMTEKYGYADWYDWSVNNWGTKWDADVQSWEVDGDDVYISFYTAWAPPTALYDKLYAEGWEITGTYCEEGMCFVGEYNDGQESYYEYANATADTILDYIPEHLDEEYGISDYMKEYEDEEEMG